MYFRNFTTLFVKYSYLYFSSHGVYGSKVKKGNKHQYVNECHLISYHWSNKASYKRIQEHLKQKYQTKRISYGTVVQLCTIRNRRKLSAKR